MMLPMVDNFWQAQVVTFILLIFKSSILLFMIIILIVIIIIITIMIIGSGDVDTPNATLHPVRLQCLSLFEVNM